MSKNTGWVMNDETYIEEHNHTYDNWRAVTESDFVTLFIKTWFAFVSTLRELYPDSIPYYEASGDSRFVEKFKSEFAEKYSFICKLTDGVKQNLHSTYNIGLKIISEKYPRFLVKDFYKINNAYKDKYKESFTINGYSGILTLLFNCASSEYVKIKLLYDDKKFQTKTNENRFLVDERLKYDNILDNFIKNLEQNPRTVTEGELVEFFYSTLFKNVIDILINSLQKKINLLPQKGSSQIKQVYVWLYKHFANALKKKCIIHV